MQKKIFLMQFLIFFCYELSVCPLIFKSDKVYFSSSLIAKPSKNAFVLQDIQLLFFYKQYVSLPNFSTTCSCLKSVFLLDYLLCGHQPDEHLLLDPFSKYFEGLSLKTGPVERTRILVGKYYSATSVHWLSFEDKGHLLKP